MFFKRKNESEWNFLHERSLQRPQFLVDLPKPIEMTSDFEILVRCIFDTSSLNTTMKNGFVLSSPGYLFQTKIFFFCFSWEAASEMCLNGVLYIVPYDERKDTVWYCPYGEDISPDVIEALPSPSIEEVRMILHCLYE